jgi:hypothetical protein
VGWNLKEAHKTYKTYCDKYTFLLCFSNLSTFIAFSFLGIVHPGVDNWLQLSTEVRAVKALLAYDDGSFVNRVLAIPPKSVYSAVKKTAAKIGEARIPIASSGRIRSITIPMVLAKRTGLCGVLPIRGFSIKYWTIETARLEGETFRLPQSGCP